MAGISFSKEVVQSMINVFGKEQAIDEMTGACRVWITSLVEEVIEDEAQIKVASILKTDD